MQPFAASRYNVHERHTDPSLGHLHSGQHMLEKDIENLIAQHPNDFFPHEDLQLIEQQFPIEGRRIDILFKDKLNRKIIAEVKRGILTREASGQVAEYYGLLKSRNPDEYYEMILCANVIPAERRVFLEHIGIECKELGIAYISDVARKYGYSFLDDNAETSSISPQALLAEPQSPYSAQSDEISVWIFQANPKRYDVLNALSDKDIGNSAHWLVNQHRSRIQRGHLALIWMSGAESGIYALARIECDPQILRDNPAERKYWTNSSDSEEAMRVRLSILKRFVNNPIRRSKLRNIPGLEKLSILRQFQGTNFPVRDEEWRIISQLM